jgi:mono/diheme cytochrome c family protein
MKTLTILFAGALLCAAAIPSQDEDLAKSIERGKAVYSENCISCHMGEGEGVPGTFPPLAKSDYLAGAPDNAIRAVKFGLIGKIKVNGVEYDNMMPNPGLGDEQIADVVNYILNSWGNSSEKKMVTPKVVAETKEEN